MCDFSDCFFFLILQILTFRYWFWDGFTLFLYFMILNQTNIYQKKKKKIHKIKLNVLFNFYACLFLQNAPSFGWNRKRGTRTAHSQLVCHFANWPKQFSNDLNIHSMYSCLFFLVLKNHINQKIIKKTSDKFYVNFDVFFVLDERSS